MPILEDILAAIQAQTAATKENTARLDAVLKGAQGGKAATTSTPAATTPAATTPAATTPAADDLGAKITALATTMLTTGTDEQRTKHRESLAKLNAHFGAAKASAVPADKQAAYLDALTDFSEGRTPEVFGGSAGAGGGEQSLI